MLSHAEHLGKVLPRLPPVKAASLKSLQFCRGTFVPQVLVTKTYEQLRSQLREAQQPLGSTGSVQASLYSSDAQFISDTEETAIL